MAQIRAARGASAGFTLIELIVALSILVLSLGVLFQTLSSNVRRLSDAEAETAAASVVQSVLARVGADLPLKPGAYAGTYGPDGRWRVEIVPFIHDGKMNGKTIPAMTVLVTASWGPAKNEHSLQLKTIRLGLASDE